MQTNILDWLEATSAAARMPPLWGMTRQTVPGHNWPTRPPRRQLSGVPHDAAPPGGILPGKTVSAFAAMLGTVYAAALLGA